MGDGPRGGSHPVRQYATTVSCNRLGMTIKGGRGGQSGPRLHVRYPGLAAGIRAHCRYVNLALDPKPQLGFARCRLHRDEADKGDFVTVVDHTVNVTDQELPRRVVVCALLPTGLRGDGYGPFGSSPQRAPWASLSC
jgi:hypothetical protein